MNLAQRKAIATLLLLGAVLWHPANVAADDASTRSTLATDPSGDIQELWLLGPEGPFVVRLYLERDGRGYQSVWGDFLWEFFTSIDLDGSFDLDYQEFQRGQWDLFVRRRADDGGPLPGELSFLDLDANPSDGRITFAEFVDVVGHCACRVRSSAQRSGSEGTDSLFVLLDRDGDGGLDRAEIGAARAVLRWLDQNDDELYSQTELQPLRDPMRNFMLAAPVAPTNTTTNLMEGIAVPLPTSTARQRAGALLRHYGDLGGRLTPDAALSPEQFRIAAETFAAIDADADGRLDLAELTAWLEQRPADVELQVRTDNRLEPEERVTLLSREEALAAAAIEVRRRGNKALVIRCPLIEVEFEVPDALDAERSRAQITNIFENLDRDNNGYLDADELAVFNLLPRFAAADTDRDGQVFLEEWSAFAAQQDEWLGRRIRLNVADAGSTLFDLLDGIPDRHLDLTELTKLAALASEWDRNGDGRLDKDEIPRRYRVVIERDRPAFASILGAFVLEAPMPPRRAGIGDGPLWFHRMDRNGDGNVSQREFLGPRDDFDRWDRNGDGRIELEEAQQVESSP